MDVQKCPQITWERLLHSLYRANLQGDPISKWFGSLVARPESERKVTLRWSGENPIATQQEQPQKRITNDCLTCQSRFCSTSEAQRDGNCSTKWRKAKKYTLHSAKKLQRIPRETFRKRSRNSRNAIDLELLEKGGSFESEYKRLLPVGGDFGQKSVNQRIFSPFS